MAPYHVCIACVPQDNRSHNPNHIKNTARVFSLGGDVIASKGV